MLFLYGLVDYNLKLCLLYMLVMSVAPFIGTRYGTKIRYNFLRFNLYLFLLVHSFKRHR